MSQRVSILKELTHLRICLSVEYCWSVSDQVTVTQTGYAPSLHLSIVLDRNRVTEAWPGCQFKSGQLWLRDLRSGSGDVGQEQVEDWRWRLRSRFSGAAQGAKYLNRCKCRTHVDMNVPAGEINKVCISREKRPSQRSQSGAVTAR